MKKIARLLALILVVALCVSAFAGCSSAPKENTPPATDPAAPTGGNEPAPTEAAFAGYPMEGGELSYWMWRNGNVGANYTSIEQTPWAEELAKQTGVTVDFIDDHSNTDEALQLMIANGDYPDIISIDILNYAGGGPAGAFADGIAIPLNDIIDKYCPNLRAYLDANPDIDKMIKTDDGIYYTFPSINAASAAYTMGGYCRQDWLDEMGEEVPTTIEGWHDLLVKVKETYNVVPYTATWANLIQYSPFAYAFGVAGNATFNGFGLDDNGQAVYALNTENYKAFLETMAQWYAEGLIEPDIAAIAAADVNAKMINGQAFMTNGWLGSAMASTQEGGAAIDPNYQLVAVPTPVVKEGDVAEYAYATNLFSGTGAAISSDCEDVELAARFLDYFYSEEGYMLNNYGIEGVSYEMVDGKPVFTEAVLVDYPEGWSVTQSLARYSLAVSGGPMVKDEDFYPQNLTVPCAQEAPAIWGSVEGGGFKHNLPGLTYTAEESEIFTGALANIKTYVNEMSMGFILGTISMDQWDTYVASIDGMGLGEATEIVQAALVRYNAR